MTRARVVVFSGPTLEARAITRALHQNSALCHVFGPARQGDIIRAGRLGAEIILLIDGYFQSVPAVWHKEILWALAKGARVLGAASMGALRAAELHTFGMVGIGSIFESFRDGILDRDDEVAVAHMGAEYGYRSNSEALVNVRATLSAAESAGIVDAEEAALVVSRTAAMFYPDRNWPAILEVSRADVGPRVADALAGFLRSGGRVDQKRADATLLVKYAGTLADAPPAAPPVNFSLQHTVWFDKMHRTAGEFVAIDAPADADGGPADDQPAGARPEVRAALPDVTDELRLARRYRHVLRTALLRRLATDEAERRGVQVSADQVARHANDVCREIGIADQAGFEFWLTQNGITVTQFNSLIELELRSTVVLTETHRAAQAELADVLRMTGIWPTVSGRAARKAELLNQAGLADPGFENTPFTADAELVSWWLDTSAPSPGVAPDIDSAARSAGFGDRASFIQALLREYCAQSLGLEPLHDEKGRL